MEEWMIREDAFLGKLTAGATHELRNILAVIKESNGLIEDLLKIKREDSKINKKFLMIKDQIQRGNNLLSALNRHAHLSDHLFESINIKQCLEDMLLLSERLLRQNNIEAKLKHCDNITIKTIPTTWCMIHFAVLMCIAEESNNKNIIEIDCFNENGMVVLTLKSTSSSNNDFQYLNSIINENSFKEKLASINATIVIKKTVKIITNSI